MFELMLMVLLQTANKLYASKEIVYYAKYVAIFCNIFTKEQEIIDYQL